MAYGYRVADVDGQDEQPSKRGPGRPRKWANDAERVRAYRARKAAEHADVDQLRRDRRALRRQVADLFAKLARAEGVAAEANRHAELLAAGLDEARTKLRGRELDVKWFREELTAARQQRDEALARVRQKSIDAAASLARPDETPSTLSRAQRRALERRRRCH
jgi:chromosome segregation ATPase